MTEIRILVTATGGGLAPLNMRLLREVRRHDVWIAAVDASVEGVGRYFADYFAAVPNGDEAGYVDAIVEIVKQQKINFVLPWSDEEALALAEHRHRIEELGATLTCTDFEMLKTMNDKAASFKLLDEAGIRIPDWTLANTKEELEREITRLHDAQGEFVVKPLVARGNRGTIVVRADVQGASNFRGSRELHMDMSSFMASYFTATADEIPIMVMERLEAPAYDIDVLAKGGRMLRAMPRERLNPAGVPFTGGILRPREDLLSLAERITETLKLNWLYDYDIMTSREGEPVVIELNPRPSGSIAAAILAGVPFYDDMFAMALGEELEDIEPVQDIAVVPFTECALKPLSSLP